MGAVHKLNARKVATVNDVGRLSDGDGLYLYVKKTGRKSWVYMWKKNGKRREMGLGGYPSVSLARARSRAQEQREIIADGGDPIALKLKARTVPIVTTFGEAADHLIETLKSDWSSEKHRQQWKRTVQFYCKPIRSQPVKDIDTDDVLRILKPIWTTKEETARRLRSRVERILDYSTAHGWREGENPARWKGHLKDLLPKRDSKKKSNFAAMPYEDIPKFLIDLQKQEGSARLALEFTIHTAARTSEALEAVWDEIDFEKKLWEIPANRMKGKQAHIVPLSSECIKVLKAAHAIKISDYVFPGGKIGRPLSNMSMNMLMRRMDIQNATVHGFRSSFRDWCGDKTEYPREVAEAALAHKVGNKVEQAYRRRNALEKRKSLMADWSAFCIYQTQR